jgi:tetratricopeptide (TPR) repeat protein
VNGWLRIRVLIATLGVCGIIAIAVTLAYSPGLHGPFVFDDIPNIAHNPAIQISTLHPSSLYAAAVSSPSSALGRPLAILSFAVNYFVAGDLSNTSAFKLTNLAIHLTNTALVYWFVLLLLKQVAKTNPTLTNMRWLPALVAAFWSLHPLNLTSVLYVVQRMTSLSALFVLLGMILFLYGRQRAQEQKRHGMTLIVGGWFMGLILGTGAKETAVLILLYIPLTEYVFFSRADFRTAAGAPLRAFYGLAIILPLLAILVWVLTHPQFIQESYKIRNFDMTARLLTEPRVLWFYLYLLFIPNITEFSLFHDDIPISTGLFTPWTTLPAILALLALTAAAFVGRKKYPIFSFAVLWFLVGHSLESSFLPLEIAHEHRNYLPAIGPLMATVYALGAAFSKRNRIFLTLCATLAVALASITFLRAQAWASEEQLIVTMAQHHPRSASAQAMLAELYAVRKGDLIQAQRHYEAAAALDPNEMSYPIRILINGMKISSLGINGSEKGSSLIEPDLLHTVISTQLRDHIKDQLSRKAPTATTMLTLDDLASRITQAPLQYHDLYPYAVDWYQAILNNPNASRDIHAATVIHLFEISAAVGDHATALDTVVTARLHDPADASYALMEADARIALHQLERAEEILLYIKRNPSSSSADTMNDVDILLARIRALRINHAKP